MFRAKHSMGYHGPSNCQIHTPPENHDHDRLLAHPRQTGWGISPSGMARPRPPLGPIVDVMFDSPKYQVAEGNSK